MLVLRCKDAYYIHISNNGFFKGFPARKPSSHLKPYGLAIDREVSFIMSPSSDRAKDRVFSSSAVKLAGLPFTALPLIR